jgi:hypothetical protein
MAEAKIKLPNGTEVAITGSPEEIARVVSLYNETADTEPVRKRSKAAPLRAGETAPEQAADSGQSEIDLASILNTINDCDESEAIEQHVLDEPDVVNRVLMCLYINEKYFNSSPPMTTGEISQILKQLGVPVTTPNVSLAISRKANSYVMYDGVRKKGAIVRYSLNRRGMQYFQEVLGGSKKTVATRAKKPATAKKAKSVLTPKKEPTNKKSPASKKKDAGYKPKFNKQLDLHGLKDFVGRYDLKNNSDYLITFCKFLKETAGIDPVNGDDVFTCFSDLKSIIKIPGSFMNTLRNAQNRDHFITYDRGFVNLALTPRGENHFNHEIAKRKKADGK